MSFLRYFKVNLFPRSIVCQKNNTSSSKKLLLNRDYLLNYCFLKKNQISSYPKISRQNIFKTQNNFYHKFTRNNIYSQISDKNFINKFTFSRNYNNYKNKIDNDHDNIQTGATILSLFGLSIAFIGMFSNSADIAKIGIFIMFSPIIVVGGIFLLPLYIISTIIKR